MDYCRKTAELPNCGKKEQSVLEAARIMSALQKLKETRSKTAGPERDAEVFFLERKISEYRDDLNRVQPR